MFQSAVCITSAWKPWHRWVTAIYLVLQSSGSCFTVRQHSPASVQPLTASDLTCSCIAVKNWNIVTDSPWIATLFQEADNSLLWSLSNSLFILSFSSKLAEWLVHVYSIRMRTHNCFIPKTLEHNEQLEHCMKTYQNLTFVVTFVRLFLF